MADEMVRFRDLLPDRAAFGQFHITTSSQCHTSAQLMRYILKILRHESTSCTAYMAAQPKRVTNDRSTDSKL